MKLVSGSRAELGLSVDEDEDESPMTKLKDLAEVRCRNSTQKPTVDRGHKTTAVVVASYVKLLENFP